MTEQIMNLLKALSICTFAAAAFSVSAQSVVLEANQCKPEAIKQPTVVGMAVRGELSGFDPCHASVSFKVPATLANSKKPPLVIAVHGGGGRADAEAITNVFFANGMATLIFDAYRHNGVPPRTGNAYRQMMLYKVALQAYQWALTRQDVDTQRIYFYGISNGASVVINLASVVDPRHVQGVFSEAPTPVGIGYPWEIQVPVLIAFGKQDDLGARVGQRRWMISDPCRFNVRSADVPSGTADHCSDANPSGTMLTTLQWAEKVKAKNAAKVETQYFDDVAHGAFLGPLKIQTAQQFAASRGFQMPADMGWSEGGTPAGQQALLRAALQFFGVAQ
jgi:dienelactone hydrolase